MCLYLCVCMEAAGRGRGSLGIIQGFSNMLSGSDPGGLAG